MKKLITLSLLITMSILFGFTPKPEGLNYQSLWSELKANDIQYPEIVFAQAILESGHFKSVVCRTNNNLFGMKYPKVRKSMATGSRRGYAIFPDWKASVQDYKLWQDRFLKRRSITNSKEYLMHLDRMYSETRGYSAMLKKIIKDFSYLS
jgi:uncharacterized FlgJ-related protein